MTRRSATILDRFLEEALHEGAPLAAGEPIALAVAPQAAPDGLRSRLLDSLTKTHRFDDLDEVVAKMTDLPLDRVAELLLDVDRPDVWEAGPTDAIRLRHFQGGEAVRNAVTGLVRVEAGHTFPLHSHVGDEQVLVLQGAFEDSHDGVIYRPGDLATMAAGSEHTFRAIGPVTLVTVAVVQGGVVIGGETIPPGDPRA